MKTIKLIKGLYTPNEAKEILLDMLDSKINFHKIKSLSSLVRCNQPNAESEARIEELKEARGQILKLIQEAREGNTQLRIESTVHISPEGQEAAEAVCLKEGKY